MSQLLYYSNCTYLLHKTYVTITKRILIKIFLNIYNNWRNTTQKLPFTKNKYFKGGFGHFCQCMSSSIIVLGLQNYSIIKQHAWNLEYTFIVCKIFPLCIVLKTQTFLLLMFD